MIGWLQRVAQLANYAAAGLLGTTVAIVNEELQDVLARPEQAQIVVHLDAEDGYASCRFISVGETVDEQITSREPGSRARTPQGDSGACP